MTLRPERCKRERRIALIASNQHTLITAAQLISLGLGRSAIDARRAAGRLHRHYRGVYSLLRSLPTIEARLLAPVLSCGPDAALTCRSTLVLWGVCRPRPGPIDVTTPTRRGRLEPRIRAHRARLAPSELTRRSGIPTTTVERALLDFAAEASEAELRSAIEEAVFQRLLSWGKLQAQLERRAGHRGTARLRRILGARGAPVRIRSGLEERFLELIAEAGIEEPLVNHRVRTPEGTFEVDFCWPASWLIVETDGRSAHDSDPAFHRDRDRDQCLGLAGWRVHRFTPGHVFDRPAQTTRRLAALLRAAAGDR